MKIKYSPDLTKEKCTDSTFLTWRWKRRWWNLLWKAYQLWVGDRTSFNKLYDKVSLINHFHFSIVG